MKKLLLGLIPLALLISCDKSDTIQVSQTQKVTIGYRLVEQNTMPTKALAGEEIVFAISQDLPTQVDLILKNGSEQFVVKTHQETEIAAGTYTYSGTSYGGQVGEQINTGCYFTVSPYITFAGSLEIIKGTSQYYVNGTYKSFAIVVDYDEIASAEYKKGENWLPLTFNRHDNAGTIFAQGNYYDAPLQIKLIPKDTNHKETIFSLTTNSSTQKYTYVQSGYYYFLHPQSNDDKNPTIDISFLDFAQGTVNI